MQTALDKATVQLDMAKEAISWAFAAFGGEMDYALQDLLNKADGWLTAGLVRIGELSGDGSVAKMSIEELFSEAESLEEQIAEASLEEMKDLLPVLQERLKAVEDRLRKEGEI